MRDRVKNKEHKKHIDQLQNAYVEIKAGKMVPSRPAITLANTLTRDIETLFKGQNKYLLELLQNADDSAEESPQTEFILIDNYFIVRHNGRPFNYQDVEKICDNAQQIYRDKIEDIHKTGYKGIGFKAIFSISDEVSIFSDEYQFRFDKDYWKRECEDFVRQPVPWPLIPIWTEKSALPDVIQAEMRNDALTHFVIRLKDPQKIMTELNQLQNNPESLLFLRKVRRVVLQYRGKTYCIEVRVHDLRREIYVNEQLKKAFLQSRIFNIIIDERTKNEISKLSDFECPPRIKHAETVPMQFAVLLDAKGHIDIRATENHNLIYCYLPTQVNLSVPYITNSDFLLNADRTTLLNNVWNQYLFNMMAQFHFWWLRELIKTDYRDQILYLVGKKDIAAGYLFFNNDYKAGFELAYEGYDFVPNCQNADTLLTLSKGIVDTIEFWRKFPELSDSRYPRERIVRYELEKLELESERRSYAYGGYSVSSTGHFKNIFNRQRLLDSLDKYIKQSKDIAVQARLIKYLHQQLEVGGIQQQRFFDPASLNNGSTVTKIESAFLLCDDGVHRQPKDIYLIPADADDRILSDFPKFVPIHHLHQQLLIALPKAVQKWLIDLGVKEFSIAKLIIDEIIPCLKINNSKINNSIENHLRLFAFLFHHLAKEKELPDLAKEIYVLNKLNRYVLVSQCFFSDEYQPINPLDGYVKPEQQLSSDYLTLFKKSGLSVESIRKGFQLLGVIQNEFLLKIPEYTYQQAQQEQRLLVKKYFESLSHRSVSPSDPLSVLIDMPILDRQSDGQQWRDLFWEKLSSHWGPIQEHPPIQYQGRVVQSFLQYRLQQCSSLFHAGSLLKSTDFFTEEFKEFRILPTLPPHLPKALIQWMGAKSKLDLDKIIEMLTIYNRDDKSALGLYAKLLRLLLEMPQLAPADLEKLRHWSGCLPAQNDTLQPVRQLKCFAVQNTSDDPPISPYWLKELRGFNRESMIRIAHCFGIPCIAQIDTRIIKTGEVAHPGPIQAFQCILPMVALLEYEKDKSNSAVDVLFDLMLKLEKLTAYSVESLSIERSGITSLKRCWRDINKLYFKGTWPSQHIGEIFDVIGQFLDLSVDVINKVKNLIYYYSEENLVDWLREEGLSEPVYRDIIMHMMADQACQEDEASPFEGAAAAAASKVVEQDEPVVSPLSSRENVNLFKLSEQHLESPAIACNSALTKISRQEHKAKVIDAYRSDFNDEPADRPFEPTITAQAVQIGLIEINKILAGEEVRISLPAAPARDGYVATPSLFASSSASVHHQHGSVRSIVPRDAAAIGRWGEEVVFRWLQTHYRTKSYYECEYQETTTGFEMIGYRTKNGTRDPFKLQVIWLNRQGESSVPVDFQIIKNGQIRYIEVKTTRSEEATEFLSGSFIILFWQGR